MINEIASGIVLYNPEIERLRQNLDAVSSQVSEIFLVDNASENITEIEALLTDYPKCRLIKNTKNSGIARGLNQIMASARQVGYRWVLTLDDDSICDSDLVARLSLYTSLDKAGIICPLAVDDRIESVKTNPLQREYMEVRDCITAGSLTNVSVWSETGGFDEKMFIDFVDIEYCTRIREYGYKIWRISGTYVHQRYGNIKGSFQLFGKKFYLFDYSPVRVYYSVRNQIYFMKKHRSQISICHQLIYLIGYIGKRIVFEGNRVESLISVCRGIRDGIRM